MTEVNSRITPDQFKTLVDKLTQSDRDLARVVANYGYPDQWQREPGFAALIRTILGQQVSFAAAKATYAKLLQAIAHPQPETFLTLDDAQLKAIGFSRQKTRYGRILAQAILDQELDLVALNHLPDEEIRQQLTKIKGIGDWTVDIYLMMALQRPNVFPAKDLAVAIAIQELKNLPTRPTAPEITTIAEAWQPYRAIATKILWHYYLHRKAKPLA